MSFETEIKPTDPSQDGQSRFEMSTTTWPDVRIGTVDQLRSTLAGAGRFYQPLIYLDRAAMMGGFIYLIAGFTGHELPFPNFGSGSDILTDQKNFGVYLYILHAGVDYLMGTRISKWQSKVDAFKKHFPDERISLIPDRFNPGRLWGK